MMPGRRMEILKRMESGDALPSLSPLTVKLIEMASDDSCSARDIADLISRDPSLTTRLLKLSNSAFFSTRNKVSTLSRAVVLLGVSRVRSLALGLSLRDTFPMGVQGCMDYDRFWKISLYRALIAQELSKKINSSHHEEAFVAGLTLEIGQLMLYKALEPEQQKQYPGEWLPTLDILKWEKAAAGIHHREVGRIILIKWRFPSHLVEPQAYLGVKAFGEDVPVLARLCELARLGSESLFAQGNALYQLQKIVYNSFQITPKAINEMLIDVVAQVEETAEALRIEADQDKDLISIMERANHALQRLNMQMAGQIQRFLDHAGDQTGNEELHNDKQVYRVREQAIESALQAVAHEIRNPLLSLGGFVRRLSKSIGENSDYIKEILSEATRIDRVLHELSDFSRRYQPDFCLSNITRLLEEMLEQLAETIAKSKVDVVRRYNPQDIPDMYLDVNGIKEVLNQCLVNALPNKNNGDLRLVLTVQKHPSHGDISVGFEDTGGLPNETLLEVLADPIINSKTFGTGLGLPMARKIVAWHGGRIEIKAGSLGGKRVEIFLPLSLTLKGNE